MVSSRLGLVRVRPTTVLLMLALGLLGMAASLSTTATRAAAPFPSLDGCLGSGSFRLQDDACSHIRPTRGDQFGPISSVQRVTLQPGESVILSYPGGDSIDFDAPVGACGENGCPRATVHWRAAGTGAGVGFESGCGPNEPSCQVSISPSIGDQGEAVAVVFAQHYNGITPVDGVAYAIYAPPQLYPVRVDPITTTGTAIQAESGEAAYAVRDGTSALQAECVASDWWIAASRQAQAVAPRCITLTAGDGSYQGVLPNERRWTITAAPAGGLLQPIGTRPTGYRRITVAPADNDVWETITREDRPVLEVALVPETTTMDLGATQEVTLTLRAVGGDSGTLADITFSTPDTLEVVASPDSALGIGTATGDVATPLQLGIDASKSIRIPVTALGLGTTVLRVTATAIDDIGGLSMDGVSIPITVGFGDVAEDPSLPTPVISHARDIPASFSDTIEGTIAGDPASQVVVSLASARRPVDGACAQAMSGDSVESLGSVSVDIGADGIGSFQLTRRLGPQRFVYGVAVSGSAVSPVGECVAVTSSAPLLSVDEAEIEEAAGSKGETSTAPASIIVRLSDPSELPVSVTVSTADGSAVAPDDYLALAPTTLTFEPGQVSLPVTIDIVGDGTEEGDEAFSLVLADVVGGSLDPAAEGGIITVLDPAETANAGDPSDLRGTYSVRAKVDGTWSKVQKRIYEVTRYDRKTGRLVNERPGYKLTFTVQGDRMTASTKGKKGYVPVYWDCTISTGGDRTVIRCEVDQPKYNNLKADHWVEEWTKD